MKIAVNTRLLLKDKLSGIGWFSHEILKRITRNHPEHEFIFLFDRKWDEDFIFSENITPLALSPQARHPVLYYIWFEYSIPRALRRVKADLFISPDGYLSLSTRVPSIAVIHDLNFEHNSQYLTFAEKKYNLRYFPRFAHRAEKLITVSEFSKKDIMEHYGVADEKIDVVYNAAREIYHPVDEEVQTRTREKYTEGKPFFLYIGVQVPRKNLDGLLLAYDEFRERSGQDVKLLVVGQALWRFRALGETLKKMHYREDVIFLGPVYGEELVKILGSAMALTFFSKFEGFGIPVVEAFRCHTPVLTSNVASLPEIAGEAALMADPYSADSMASAMVRLAGDPELRRSLIKFGTKRSNLFQWDLSAERFWESVLRVI